MWQYKDVTRQQFECIKDKVERYIVLLGGRKIQLDLPDAFNTISHTNGNVVVGRAGRDVYAYNGELFRVDEVCFAEKPFIVIEYCESVEEVQKNQMIDADPFPYDLSDEELLAEVKYSMGLEPYPKA